MSEPMSPPPPPAAPGRPPPATNPAQQVQGPAIGLIITAVVGILFVLLALSMHGLGMGMGAWTPWPAVPAAEYWSTGRRLGHRAVASSRSPSGRLPRSGSAMKMKALRAVDDGDRRRSVVAMIPCIARACILGLPIGIWAGGRPPQARGQGGLPPDPPWFPRAARAPGRERRSLPGRPRRAWTGSAPARAGRGREPWCSSPPWWRWRRCCRPPCRGAGRRALGGRPRLPGLCALYRTTGHPLPGLRPHPLLGGRAPRRPRREPRSTIRSAGWSCSTRSPRSPGTSPGSPCPARRRPIERFGRPPRPRPDRPRSASSSSWSGCPGSCSCCG